MASEFDIPLVHIQLVLAGKYGSQYPFIDLTFWTEHDVLDQPNLTSKMLRVCSSCHGAVLDGVCSSCYRELRNLKEDMWEGLLLTGGTEYVASEVAKVYNNLYGGADVTLIRLPRSSDSQTEFLSHSHFEDEELLRMGEYSLLHKEDIKSRVDRGSSLKDVFCTFLGV